ncbi:unnamed protein product [Symbiodinium sp. CCMP2592]|nr:unnamed protein product [Symbiodinium sp. CCMP2592]
MRGECKLTTWHPFQRQELEHTLATWAKNKSTGPDGISHEAAKALLADPYWGDKILYTLNAIFYVAKVSESVDRDITVLLPKIPQPLQWGDTRPITLRAFLQWARKGRQGVELVAIIRRVARDWGVWMWLVKLDIRKAFDSVWQHSMSELVAARVGGVPSTRCPVSHDGGGMPWDALLWLSILHTRTLNIAVGDTIAPIPQANGIRQGSPDLFGAIVARDLQKAVETAGEQPPDPKGGPPPHRTGGSFLDDTYLWSQDRDHLQRTLCSLEKELEEDGLKTHPTKTAILYSKPTGGGSQLTADATPEGDVLPTSPTYRAMGRVAHKKPANSGGEEVNAMVTWKNMAFRREQQNKPRKHRVTHVGHFNPESDVERAIEAIAGTHWGEVAQDRKKWQDLTPAFTARFDVPWATGKQQAIQDNLLHRPPPHSQPNDDQFGKHCVMDSTWGELRLVSLGGSTTPHLQPLEPPPPHSTLSTESDRHKKNHTVGGVKTICEAMTDEADEQSYICNSGNLGRHTPHGLAPGCKYYGVPPELGEAQSAELIDRLADFGCETIMMLKLFGGATRRYIQWSNWPRHRLLRRTSTRRADFASKKNSNSRLHSSGRGGAGGCSRRQCHLRPLPLQLTIRRAVWAKLCPLHLLPRQPSKEHRRLYKLESMRGTPKSTTVRTVDWNDPAGEMVPVSPDCLESGSERDLQWVGDNRQPLTPPLSDEETMTSDNCDAAQRESAPSTGPPGEPATEEHAAEQLYARVLQDIDDEGERYAMKLREKKAQQFVVTGKSSSHQARSLRVTKPNRAVGGDMTPTTSTGGGPSISQAVLRVAREADAAYRLSGEASSSTRTHPTGAAPDKPPLKRKQQGEQ